MIKWFQEPWRGSRAVWLAVVVGCAGEGPTPPPPPAPTTGSIQVVASTTGIKPDTDGYSVLLDGARSLTIASNGIITFSSIDPGRHVVDFGGLAVNCTTPTIGLSVNVVAGRMVELELPVTCGRLAFVSGWASGGFSVIETVTYTHVFRGLTNGHSPIGPVANAEASRIYFNQTSVPRPDIGVGIFTTEPLENAGFISLPGQPLILRLSADESELYVLHYDGALSFVDLASGVETDRILFGVGPFPATGDMALTPDGERIYVTDFNSGHLHVFDVPGRRLLRSRLITPHEGVAIELSPDGTRVYMRTSDNLSGNNMLFVLDQATEQVLNSVDLGEFAWGLLVHPDGSVLYVPLGDTGRVVILDAVTLQEVGSVAVARPRIVTLGPDEETLYVTTDTDELVAISLDTGQELGRVTVGGGPWDVIFWPPN